VNPKNKSAKRGMFFVLKLRAFFSPRFTTQFTTTHHQKTTSKHALFPKPHKKAPINLENRFHGRPKKFTKTNDF